MTLQAAIAIICGYFLGSIPSAYIAGRLKKGVDIRQLGGGNMGTLNALRELGLATGIIVLIADFTKGALAILIARWLGLSPIWVFFAGFAAIIGHDWPVFLKFRGGKGAATTLAVLLALAPREVAVVLGMMAVIIVVTSNIRLAIAIGLALLPLILWLFTHSLTLISYSLALALFLVIRSLPSIRREFASGKKRNLIFDREYHFWQARKSK